MKSIFLSLASPAPQSLLRLSVAALLGAFVLAALAQALLGFDAARIAAWLPGCLFHALTDLPCPGCGMTRALLLLSQLRVAESLAMHPAALPTVLAAALFCTRPQWLNPARQGRAAAVALVALLGLWAMRLLPVI